MTENDLGRILREMYENAPRGEQVAHIHLFGIKYADEIRRQDFKLAEIIRASGINKSYVTELNKGVNLAKYVIPK